MIAAPHKINLDGASLIETSPWTALYAQLQRIIVINERVHRADKGMPVYHYHQLVHTIT